jgi:hypothetical protein
MLVVGIAKCAVGIPDTSLVHSESTPQGSISSFKLTAHVASTALPGFESGIHIFLTGPLADCLCLVFAVKYLHFSYLSM